MTLLIVHSTLYGRLLQRWADRRHIPVVADLMERHEPMQFTRGRLDPQYLRHRRLSRLCARRPAGLLLISTQLRAVVRPRVPALVVPPFVDTDEFMPSAESAEDAADNLSLAYAGTPNNKDLLGPVVDAIADLDPASRARVKLTIAGPTKERLLQLGEVQESALQACGGSVEIVGRLSRRDVRRLWRASDLCVLVRPQMGYAVAGFPSKVPEAMAAGCALFGTAHGDLAAFTHDGGDAILAATSSRQDVGSALHRALMMSRTELDALREAARTGATDSLSVTAWAPRISTFLAQLDGHRRR
ncbi:glycosyltransferase [Terrabacter sp. LjRoot27]|uniref:glycosyltransferase n=1 Tax=Terrabacter sp. LjRoot27 TaxID=3342306 RepID=UPI003ECE2E41